MTDTGDLDANWIESMNSVMDDNRLLTLPSNERIPLKAREWETWGDENRMAQDGTRTGWRMRMVGELVGMEMEGIEPGS